MASVVACTAMPCPVHTYRCVVPPLPAIHIRRCLISFPKRCPEDCVHSHMPTGSPWKPSKTLEILVFLHAPSKGGPYCFRQNLTVSPKTFKNLVKMNVFTVRSCASPSPARSGPRFRSRIPRGALQKTIGITCVSACPPKGLTLLFPSKPYCFSETL